MSSSDSSSPVDPAVLEAVHAIDALRQVHREGVTGSGSVYDDWDIEGLTGFSLKFGYGEGLGDGLASDDSSGQLVIETYVRERILFIDISNTFDPATQGTVKAYKVEMADGSAVPDWIRIVRDGFVVAERPANLWDLELRISAEMSDGSVVSRGVSIDGPTGEIQPIILAEPSSPPLFQDQLRSLADSDRVLVENAIRDNAVKS